MPTRSEVMEWKPWRLSEWAETVRLANTQYDEQLNLMPKHFNDLGGSWYGRAHDAAYDRVGEEAIQGRKLGTEVNGLVTALQQADSRLTGERDTLLAKASDGEATFVVDGRDIAMSVSDQWVVSTTATFPGPVSPEIVQKIQDEITARQNAINTAYTNLTTAVTEVRTSLDTVVNTIKSYGSLLGDGFVPSGTAQQDPLPVLSGDLGASDGDAVADGKLDPAELDRVAANLRRTGLTAEQLAALGRGEDVTIPQSTMDYLNQFYNHAGRDGLLSVSEQLKITNTDTAQQLRHDLGNGMMTLSNEKVVSKGRPGEADDRGNWNKLDPEIREIIGTRPQEGFLKAPDANTRDIPDDYRGSTNGRSEYHQDLAKLAGLLNNADAGYQPGTKFGVELSRQAAHTAYFIENPDPATAYAPEGFWKPGLEQTAQDLLGAGTRNNDANHALLTGKGSDELFGKDTPGQSWQPYNRDNVLTPLMKHEWADDGAAASKMFSWIENDATSPNISTSTRAGEAAAGLSNYVTKNYDMLMNLDGDRTASLGQVNPRLVQGFSDALNPYVGELAGVDPKYLQTHGFNPPIDQVGEWERKNALKIFTLMDTDREASIQFNGKAIQLTGELQAAWANSALTDPANPAHQLASRIGTIQGLVDGGLDAEAADRTRDNVGEKIRAFTDKGEAYDAFKSAVSTGVKQIPVLGTFLGPAIDTGNTAFKNSLIGVALPADPASPRLEFHNDFEPGRQFYQIAQVVQSRDGFVPHLPQYDYLFDGKGQLKDYQQLITVDKVDRVQLDSDLTNILTSYNNGVLATNLGILDDKIEEGRERAK